MVTYTWLIGFFCKAGEIDDAWALMDEMIENGYEPDAVVYNPLLQVLLREGKRDLALSLACTMIEKGCRPNEMTYRIMHSRSPIPMMSSHV
jgi:pentatricopeptide repeat protein